MKNENIDKIRVSHLHPYSIGIVTEDIDLDNIYNKVKIYPIEILTDSRNEIMEEEDIEVEIPEEDMTTSVKIKRSYSVYAKWLGLGQYNRLTPPCVRKGEYVMLYRVANSDEYYWETLYNDEKLRKEEIVRYAWSVKPNIDENEELDKMYYLEIDTRSKIIKLHTTNEYGEYTTYDITIDTGNGKVTLEDGKGNFITLDSTTDLINIKSNLTIVAESATINVLSGVTNLFSSNLVKVKAPKIELN